jgi:pimeloyl-ACP methyl ester carboxylesterase
MQGVLYRVILAGLCLSAASVFAAPKTAVFAVLAGYNSCKNATRGGPRAASIPMANAYARTLKNLQTKVKDLQVITLYSCLNDDAPPDAEAEYVLSTSPRIDRSGNTRDIRAELEAIYKSHPEAAVYFVGHSYGGWMSMYLTQTLAGKPNLKGLFTIDPIGPECGTAGVIFGSSECHSAPSGLENKNIKSRAGVWLNFFQREDTWLTSSKVREADENHEILFDWGPHSWINAEKKVWDRIEAAVLKSL